MRPGRRADIDNVDVVALDDAAPVGRDLLDPVGSCRLFHELAPAAADQPEARADRQVAQPWRFPITIGIGLAHYAIADDADPNLRQRGHQHSSPPFCNIREARSAEARSRVILSQAPQLPRRHRGRHLVPQARLRPGALHLARARPLPGLRPRADLTSPLPALRPHRHAPADHPARGAPFKPARRRPRHQVGNTPAQPTIRWIPHAVHPENNGLWTGTSLAAPPDAQRRSSHDDP
jgi:hypothetical protein